MSRTVRFVFAAALASAIFCAAASADIVVNHPPLNSGGPAADTEFINSSNDPSWQQLADDFQVSQDAVVRRISWWGFYGSSSLEEIEPPPATETMRARIYGARASDGLPDDANILFEESFFNPSREATGRIVFVGPGPPEFKFEVDLISPFAIEAGAPYWLEIGQVEDFGSLFRWEFSPGTGTPFAFTNPFVSDWESAAPLTSNLAFELSTIPEPSAFFYCSLLLSMWGRRKT
jgi:hypothetical protein